MPAIPNTSEGIECFVQRYLLTWEERNQKFGNFSGFIPKTINNADRSDQSLDNSLNDSEDYDWKHGLMPFNWNLHPSILICGHNSRDSRCGILGPLLRTEFKAHLRAEKQDLGFRKVSGRYIPRSNLRYDPSLQYSFNPLRTKIVSKTNIAMISHIGGHAFAGNVVIYIPEGFRIDSNGSHVSPLAGKGIWYGRVEPKHVEGIVEQTVKGGKIIRDLLRGVHDPPPRKASLGVIR